MKLDAHVPAGDLADKWDNHRFASRLVSPANRRKFKVIVVGTGLAGGSASASLAELGYNVTTFCLQDSPRRGHSIAAQGGINAAKNYQNDGDSVRRLFYDTIKGGDFRSREANVYRLAQLSNAIIDHCVATGVPFAREYGGLLANRSFGGAQVSRTFYARGQTGQQLLLGAYSSMMRQAAAGRVTILPRREIMDIVVTNGSARGVIARNLVTGELERHSAHAVVLATGGFGNVFYLSTNAMNSNVSAIWKAYRRGACFANPSFVQIHPTCIPVHGDHQSKLTLMSEACGTTVGCGCRKPPVTRDSPAIFRKPNGSITWKNGTPLSATWCPVTWLPGTPRSSATPDTASAPPAVPCILTLPMPSGAQARPRSSGAMAISFTCTKKSPHGTRYRNR